MIPSPQNFKHLRFADEGISQTLWYTSEYSEASWISDWEFMAGRYKSNAAVVAADLKNEPHGNTDKGMKPPASWGSDTPGYTNTDWRKAAIKAGQAILKVNPKMIIIVEGVENYGGDNSWWGGNLMGVRDYPITDSEIPAKNLWYSAHEYGPTVSNQEWFNLETFPDFPANMPAIWDRHFWFIQKEGIAPLFFGEFGISEEMAAKPDSVDYKWLTTFMKYVGKSSHWTFWCLNPDSGNTGGILQYDWVTVEAAKYAIIKPYLAGND